MFIDNSFFDKRNRILTAVEDKEHKKKHEDNIKVEKDQFNHFTEFQKSQYLRAHGHIKKAEKIIKEQEDSLKEPIAKKNKHLTKRANRIIKRQKRVIEKNSMKIHVLKNPSKALYESEEIIGVQERSITKYTKSLKAVSNLIKHTRDQIIKNSEIIASDSETNPQKANEARGIVKKAKVLLASKKMKALLSKNHLKKARHALWLQSKVNKYAKKLHTKSDKVAGALVDGLQLDTVMKSHRKLMETTNYAIMQHTTGIRRLNRHIRRMNGIHRQNLKIAKMNSQMSQLNRHLSQNPDVGVVRQLRLKLKNVKKTIRHHKKIKAA